MYVLKRQSLFLNYLKLDCFYASCVWLTYASAGLNPSGVWVYRAYILLPLNFHHSMTNQYTLYAAPISMYSGKLRAYLDNKGLAYEEIFSSLSIYKKIIIPKTGVRFIPVLKTPAGEYLQDTAHIIDLLEQRHPDNSLLPTTPKQRMAAMLLELWADEWLLFPAMHYRWNKPNFPYIYEEFGRVVLPWAPAWLRAFIGKKIGAKFKGFLSPLGINPQTTAAIEDWYENTVLAQLNKHFSEHLYLFGDKPSVADCALMGPLFAHLYQDPAPGYQMRELAPNVCAWIERMRHPTNAQHDWLDDDQVPETLVPILDSLFVDCWPLMLATIEALRDWHQQDPNESQIPRMIGQQRFSINGAESERAITPFHQWKMQRVLSAYQSFSESDRTMLDNWLAEFKAKPTMHIQIEHPVTRVNNRLTFATDTSAI